VIEESAQDRFVNSRSFSKKPGKAKKWSIEDTERFYDVSIYPTSLVCDRIKADNLSG
jgi:hypothetical protein